MNDTNNILSLKNERAKKKAKADEDREYSPEEYKAAYKEGYVDARIQERERCKLIMTSDEAKDRTSLAHHLAIKTDMPAEACITLLKVSEKELNAESKKFTTDQKFLSSFVDKQPDYPELSA